MSYDLRLPSITGQSEKEQLAQIKRYLHQLVGDLRFAFDQVRASEVTAVGPADRSAVSSVQTTLTPQATFSSIKSLIIKSADIVNAYYDVMEKRLEGLYVASSDFGTFSEKTSQDIKLNAEYIDTVFQNMQEIVTDIESIDFTLAEVNAHIKSGLLYYDDNGIPVYGLEVGQKTEIDGEEIFNKYARFTSSRLSFYDQNDHEVAYISDYKLYITNAEIRGTLTIGDYTVDPSDGLAFK